MRRCNDTSLLSFWVCVPAMGHSFYNAGEPRPLWELQPHMKDFIEIPLGIKSCSHIPNHITKDALTSISIRLNWLKRTLVISFMNVCIHPEMCIQQLVVFTQFRTKGKYYYVTRNKTKFERSATPNSENHLFMDQGLCNGSLSCWNKQTKKSTLLLETCHCLKYHL